MAGLASALSSDAQLKRFEGSQYSATQFYNPEILDEKMAEALLPLFVNIQRLLRFSSLDTDIKEESDRFDEKIDGDLLPMRDEYDKKVSNAAISLKNVLGNLLSEREVSTRLPYSHKRAIHNVFAIEIR